jgi:translation initiation factor SUI1
MVVHIRLIKNKRTFTVIEDLEPELDLKRICKVMKKTFSCNGSVKPIQTNTEVIVLQGNKVKEVENWLRATELADEIIIHGI